MHQLFRIALLSFFALMQIFSPLVHAHYGGERIAEAIHVPELEFLSTVPENPNQPHLLKTCSDIIVSLAYGFKGQGDETSLGFGMDLILPAELFHLESLPLHEGRRPSHGHFFTLRRYWLISVQRAPPSSFQS